MWLGIKGKGLNPQKQDAQIVTGYYTCLAKSSAMIAGVRGKSSLYYASLLEEWYFS